MGDITIPFVLLDVPVRPEPPALTRLSEDMQQTLSALMGYDGEGRRLLRCTRRGSLAVCSPAVTGIEVVTATGDNYTWTGGKQGVSEVMIQAHPDNAGRVYVTLDATATTSNSWILTGGDSLTITIDNYARLNLLIAANTEKAIIIRN